MAEVRLENVSKLYGRKEAVKDVNFVCKEGEFFSVVGPTGAGKSTILKMIAGVEEITSGRIYFGDRVVNNLPPQERNVSMAFETYNLYPHFNVFDNIAFPLRARRWGLNLSTQEERRRIEDRPISESGCERLPQHLGGAEAACLVGGPW
jgi:ABC-type sugar transport system ATPase subunit